MRRVVYWQGTVPPRCDFCEEEIVDTFIDGRTKQGSWAIMCLHDHIMHGVGLGLGYGQQYAKTEDGLYWTKVNA